ncbi:hypothetical protein ATY81_20920 [Rhizobium sp. R72]|uniref:hypothetical protein n=1 Tax=unclassified Rhizobium TaxID=2613769 RepID=UPI000B5298AA|nr:MULTISPECIES: hypothetical protein [unclassified Rhizobium]OWV83425.1 hypothetical protein ATY79_12385 [Rhizobium sp. R693]OWW03012.1 hypothetical protein ATY81_20920 [Rhizobium sp. R72]OWW03194.1 hypothetical protein ATY80_20920 [Rhizobium sp. R711]
MQSSRASRDGAANPTINEVHDQIERILSSGEFHAPDRGRRFLEFIVEETLSGRADYLKAYTIAQEVFARDTSFDAQNDPVVRIEAGRIRRALERYYLVAGHADSIVVTIPKGGYVPSFDYAEGGCGPAVQAASDRGEQSELQPAAPTRTPTPVELAPARQRAWMWLVVPASALIIGIVSFVHPPLLPFVTSSLLPAASVSNDGAQPRVIVEPFQNVPGKAATADIAQGLTDEIIGQLTKFREILVIAPGAEPGAEAREPRFALQGSVRIEGDKMRLIVRLTRQADGAVLWANNYDADLRDRSSLEVQTEVAQSIATTVAQPYGIIFQTNAAEAIKPDSGDWEAYSCALSYYAYRAELDPQKHAAVRDCLERATKRLPTYSSYWALLSLTYLDEVRFHYKVKAESPHPLAQAVDAAKRAVDLDPQNARALQALMLASFFSNDVDTALRAGSAAYAINPNDTEVAGEYGFRLAMSGKWDTGCELMSSAISRNPGPRGYYEVGLALCAYIRGDNQAAELWARMADLKHNPMHHLVLLAVLGASGKLDEARRERDWLQTNDPVLLGNIRKEVALRLHRPQDQERFLDGLRASGIAIPPADGMIGSQ